MLSRLLVFSNRLISCEMNKACRKWIWNNQVRAALFFFFLFSDCSLNVLQNPLHSRLIDERCWFTESDWFIYWNIKHVTCTFGDASVGVLFGGWLRILLPVNLSAKHMTMTKEQWQHKQLGECKPEAWLNLAYRTIAWLTENFGWQIDGRRGRVWSWR
jgi:hypothetical protein